ncbi:ABC transporter ATP-binding protein [Alkalicoccus halolimnae]|uniref:Carnitine transport ATP-binding protein OpuCA n=1 Tax=Alkalicoccus halolimnae TaxID=1667239 RepID=A0AAJ8N0J5_9BACI|nr:ABC transporter ATP-binding protein [Alkalicoccus halolimnae]
MLNLIQLEKKFHQETIFQNISAEINEGDIVSIVGPSGCGKTTLLRCIAGLTKMSSGRIELHGKDITAEKAEKRPVVLMFQEALLFPHLTVIQNVLYGVKYGKRRLSSKDRENQAQKMLKKVEMLEWKDKYPSQLSGGQQQRVSLARALMLQPSVLLLDEPFSSLDAHLRQSLRLWVRRFLKEEGVTALFVTHDREEAVVMGDRLIVMKDGILQQEGIPGEVYSHPANASVAGFMSDGIYVDGVFYSAASLTMTGAKSGAYKGIIEHPLYAYGYSFYRVYLPELKQSVVIRSDMQWREAEETAVTVVQKGSVSSD